MSIMKKVVKGVVNQAVGNGTSKDDVRLAKLELKKIKAEGKNLKLQANGNYYGANTVDAFFAYTKNSYSSIRKDVISLKQECIALLSSIQRLTNLLSSASYNYNQREARSTLQDNLYQAKNKFSYLYLAKDYFIILTKFASGIPLTQEQGSLVFEVAPFFDGVLVLNQPADTTKPDNSLLGSFKEVGNELKESFVGASTQKTFSLSEYLRVNYSDKISQLTLPDIDDALKRFERAIGYTDNELVTQFRIDSVRQDSNEFECSNCHSLVSKDTKYCPRCGSKIQVQQSFFCTECGSEIKPGERFCKRCGNKVE